jgi:hypothetical protein
MNLAKTAVLLLASSCALWAQSQKVVGECPPVIPTNSQEALLMEQSTNKNGCWERQKKTDGSDAGLIFRSREEPGKNYKPIGRSSIGEVQLPAMRMNVRSLQRNMPKFSNG